MVVKLYNYWFIDGFINIRGFDRWLSFKMVKGLLPISSWNSILISKHFKIQWPIPTKLLGSICYQCQHKQMTNYFFFDKDQYYIFSKAKGFPKISGLGYSGFSIPDLQYLPGSQNFGDPRK